LYYAYWSLNTLQWSTLFIVHLFQIQADPGTGWEIDSQTIGYRMCHISEQMFQ
jgi:hypothetical protein